MLVDIFFFTFRCASCLRVWLTKQREEIERLFTTCVRQRVCG